MASKNFDIDNLLEQDNTVTIVGSGLTESRGGLLNAPGITGIMTNELSIGVSNNWGTLFNSADLVQQVSQFLNQLGTTASVALGSGEIGATIQKLSPRNLFDSSVYWSGSSKPTFNIQLLFLRLRSADNVASKVQSMYQLVLPKKSASVNVGNVSLNTIQPPLGYLPTGQDSANGTVALQVGQWFRATNLVANSVDFSFSREVSTDGFPLFAAGTVSLTPFRMISIEEMQSYFIGASPVPNQGVGLPSGGE